MTLPLKRVRPVAICVVRRGDDIFVAEGFDSVKQAHFYRPLGGTIEFGEYAHETVKREFLEEIGRELVGVRYLCTLENIFEHQGNPGHEIVRVYEGRFVDRGVYQLDRLEAVEDGSEVFTSLWKPVSDFRAGRALLVPEGLLGRL